MLKADRIAVQHNLPFPPPGSGQQQPGSGPPPSQQQHQNQGQQGYQSSPMMQPQGQIPQPPPPAGFDQSAGRQSRNGSMTPGPSGP